VILDYVVGVDLGTTFSAAAIGLADRVEIFDLGTRGAAIPSVVVLRADGTMLVGEAAERRAVSEPSRTAREFKRRLGDPTPFLLGGTPYGAEALTGHLLADVIAKISEQLGGPPGQVVLTHPANYGDYKRGYLEEAARLAGVGGVDFVLEPVAAAVHYATSERLATGDLLAVYDFGGGTLDIAAVRATGDDFELVGTPEGMERFGGIDLDEAVFFHVTEALGAAMTGLDLADPATTAALAALRTSCRDAKEALSSDIDTTIPVMLPTVHTEVRLTRAEFEDMLRPRLRETMTVLERVVDSAGATYEDVSRILLVGGASRIPLVAEMIRQETGRPVAVDANPKYAVSMGAARIGLAEAGAWPKTVDAPVEPTSEPAVVVGAKAAEPPTVGERDEPSTLHEPEPVEKEPLRSEAGIRAGKGEAGEPVRHRDRHRGRWIAALTALLILIGGVIVVVSGVFSSDDDPVAGDIPAGDSAPVADDDSTPIADDDSAPIADDEIGPTPFGLVYFTQFRNPDLDGEWGLWAVADAQPPEDVASDYYPELGPYSSNDPGLLDQHLVWIERTGADLLAVTWQGAEFGDDALIGGMLEAAHRAGVAVIPLIEAYPDRSPESVIRDLDHLRDRWGDHPAWFRSHRRTPWVDNDGNRVVIVVAPEIVSDRPGLGPEDWAGVTDAAHAGGVIVLAVATDPVWVEAGQFDGLVGGPEDASFGWAGGLPEFAWFVPSVSPGRSIERVGEPDASREREGGAFYEQEWMAIAGAGRSADMVVVVSFNGWIEGTQIEPASATPPDPRYRTYAPAAPDGYLELTREFAQRVLAPGG
jgi:actin-like ATPase involved in cell morphogenesis